MDKLTTLYQTYMKLNSPRYTNPNSSEYLPDGFYQWLETNYEMNKLLKSFKVASCEDLKLKIYSISETNLAL